MQAIQKNKLIIVCQRSRTDYRFQNR